MFVMMICVVVFLVRSDGRRSRSGVDQCLVLVVGHDTVREEFRVSASRLRSASGVVGTVQVASLGVTA